MSRSLNETRPAPSHAGAAAASAHHASSPPRGKGDANKTDVRAFVAPTVPAACHAQSAAAAAEEAASAATTCATSGPLARERRVVFFS